MEIYLIHPMLVHFTIGLLLTGTVFLWGSLFIVSKQKKQYYIKVAKTMLYTGTIITFATVIFGFIAFESAPHATAEAHEKMTIHRNLALVVLVFYVLLCLYSWKKMGETEINKPLLIASLFGVVLIGITGHYGGQLVFKYQIGVYQQQGVKSQSLKSDGHSHDHHQHKH